MIFSYEKNPIPFTEQLEEQFVNKPKDGSYVPLEDYSKPRNANYRGVFKSTSDLLDNDTYNEVFNEKKFKQRLGKKHDKFILNTSCKPVV